MGLSLLLIPALGGYLFLRQFNGTRDRLAQESGYHVFFRAASLGVLLFILSRLLVYSLGVACPDIVTLWKSAVPVDYSGTAAASVALGYMAPRLLNLVPWWSREKARRKVAEDSGDMIGLVIDQALEKNQLVELSLQSGKCYIGFPVRSAFGSVDVRDIAVVPIWSGYRDENTHELKVTVAYEQVIREWIHDHPETYLNDLRVAVPLGEVVSARVFSPELYRRFGNFPRGCGQYLAVGSRKEENGYLDTKPQRKWKHGTEGAERRAVGANRTLGSRQAG